MKSANPEFFMRRAIALSRKGYPAPNPHVGCVIVRDGDIVGEGFHNHAGGPHAEVGALRQAGELAEGSDLYVTLEPCNHYGRTPPCAEAVLAAGIKRVFVAVPDPNPRAAGGCQRLEQAGLEVSVGLLQSDAELANERFLVAMRQRRPYVVIKAAMTADGFIAHSDGRSKWITSDVARREGHKLRAQMGAVLVGSGTVLADDPLLTARIRGAVHQPLRIVLDGRARLTGREKVFNADSESLWLVGGPSTSDPRQTSLGVEPRIDPSDVLKLLWEKGVTGLLVEGGSMTIRSFIESGLVNRFELFVAPKLFGAGIPWNGAGSEFGVEGFHLHIRQVRRHGPDVRLTLEPEKK